MNKSTVKIEFDNEAAATNFIKWLTGFGEQTYWTCMKCREDHEEGNITATRFNSNVYSEDPNKDKLLVTTICGRLTK